MSYLSVWLSSKRSQITNVDKDVEKRVTLYTVGRNVNSQPVWRILKKLKTELPYDPAILHLGIYPKKTKTQFEKIYAPQCS